MRSVFRYLRFNWEQAPGALVEAMAGRAALAAVVGAVLVLGSDWHWGVVPVLAVGAPLAWYASTMCGCKR